MWWWPLGVEFSIALNQPGLREHVNVYMLEGHKGQCVGTLPCNGSSVPLSMSDVANIID